MAAYPTLKSHFPSLPPSECEFASIPEKPVRRLLWRKAGKAVFALPACMPCARSGAVVKDEPKAHRRKAARSVLYFGVSVGHSDQDFAPSGASLLWRFGSFPQLRADYYRKSIGIYIGLRPKLHVDLAALVQTFRDGRRWRNVPICFGRRAVRRSPFRQGDCRVVRTVVPEFQTELPGFGQHDERTRHQSGTHDDVQTVQAAGSPDVEGVLTDLSDGRNARKWEEEAEMVGKIFVGAGNGFAARQVFRFKIQTVGCQDELSFCLSGRGAFL